MIHKIIEDGKVKKILVECNCHCLNTIIISVDFNQVYIKALTQKHRFDYRLKNFFKNNIYVCDCIIDDIDEFLDAISELDISECSEEKEENDAKLSLYFIDDILGGLYGLYFKPKSKNKYLLGKGNYSEIFLTKSQWLKFVEKCKKLRNK